MTPITAINVRRALIARTEIALVDVRSEAEYATGHPLFASQIPLERIALEASAKLPRRTCPVVIYDDGEGLAALAVERLEALDYTSVHTLEGGLKGWAEAGFELFEDVNSYSKAFGELVEHRRGTPSLPASEVKRLVDMGEPMVILDARPFEEYSTMAIPGGTNVPGAELVLRARELAPDPGTRIVVNCAGRTRSLIGAQSLINAGLPNPVHALRNGTIGWTLAGQELVYGASQRFGEVSPKAVARARADARKVAYRAGVKRIDPATLRMLEEDRSRSLYRFDVRTSQEYVAEHPVSFLHVPGGQLVQEIDFHAPTRGARIVLADELGARADMTGSWLAQMGWEVYVLEDERADLPRETGAGIILPKRSPEGRYKRPYEGIDNPTAAMKAYLDWEFRLVDQLERDSTHGFVVI